MTAVLHDAREDMVQKGSYFDDVEATEMLYADDTLLLHTSVSFLQDYMTSIEKHGKAYGLTLNFKKVEALPVRTQHTLQNSDDTQVKTTNSLKYLGCLLDENGQLTGELKRRIAMARDDFNQLAKVWNHVSVAVKTKSVSSAS